MKAGFDVASGPPTGESEGPTKVVGGSFHDTATQPYTSRDIRFTKKGDVLYAIALRWPADGKFTIASLADGSASGIENITSRATAGLRRQTEMESRPRRPEERVAREDRRVCVGVPHRILPAPGGAG